MKKTLTSSFFFLLTWSGGAAEKPVQAVPKVNLARYAGDWQEVARTPNRFEKSCASDVMVHYRLQADGKIAVRNECRKANGKLDVAKGKAHVVDRASDAKLRVSFFRPFSYPYWIIGLGEQYQWSVVGEPNRKNLWILSRTARLPQEQYERALQAAAQQGYDTGRVVRTPQSGSQEASASPANKKWTDRLSGHP